MLLLWKFALAILLTSFVLWKAFQIAQGQGKEP